MAVEFQATKRPTKGLIALVLSGFLVIVLWSPSGTPLRLRLFPGRLERDEYSGKQGRQAQLAAAAMSGPSGEGGGWEPGDDVLQRFHWAARYINATQPRGIYPEWRCPDDTRVGTRSKLHSPDVLGTTCEPWIARGSITLLHELLLPGLAKALEWSTGSSTAWLLSGHVDQLASIEHHPEWAAEVQAAMEHNFGARALQAHWKLHHIPTNPPGSDEKEDPEIFADYVAASFIPDSAAGSYDFISIDGRARVACVPKALRLLKPHGGILVIDNAQRPHYSEGIESVPKHWQRHVGSSKWGTTIVWVSCRLGRC